MRFLIILAAAGFGITPAFAANLPLPALEAPAVSSCTLTSCSGFYVGGNVVGAGSNMDILGSGISNSVFAGGGAIGMTAGGQLWNGKFFAGFEGFADYDVATNLQVTPGMGNQNRYLFGVIAKAGIGLNGLFGGVATAPATPGQSPIPISIPASIASALLSPYVAIGEVWRPWGAGWATGAGADFILSQNWNLDLKYLHATYNGGAIVNPGQAQKTDNLIFVGLNYKF